MGKSNGNGRKKQNALADGLSTEKKRRFFSVAGILLFMAMLFLIIYATNFKVNRGTVAILLNNAIDTPLVKRDDEVKAGYVIYDGKNGREYKTLRSEYF